MNASLTARRGGFGLRVGWLIIVWAMVSQTFQSNGQSLLAPRQGWGYEMQTAQYPAASWGFYHLIQVEPNRFVACGGTGVTSTESAIVRLNEFGDKNIYLNTEEPTRPNSLRLLTISPGQANSVVTTISAGPDSAGQYGLILQQFDSLGRLGWRKALVQLNGTTQMLGYDGGYPAPLPDGYLIPANYENSVAGIGHVMRTDRRGNLIWTYRMALNEWMTAYSRVPIVPAPDGSYFVLSTSIDRVPPTQPRNVWDRDWHLRRVLLTGDTLRPTFFGAKRVLERAYGMAATPDNGVVVSGDRTPFAPQAQRLTEGYVVKFDSLFRMQWQYRRPSERLLYACSFNQVYPLANGHYLAAGYTGVPTVGPNTVGWMQGLYVELAPPTQPGDTTATVVREWRTQSRPLIVLPQAGDSSAIVMGSGPAHPELLSNVASYGPAYYSHFSRIDGLIPPAEVGLCTRYPMRADSLARFRRLNNRPDSLAFTWASNGVRPGPRYAEISLVEWDFGDGTPKAEGWNVTHRFASPRPVRVRVCATNNLFCQVCQDLYPFGIPTAAPAPVPTAPQVSVYPNPSATGVFTVRGAGGATATVVDALGRVVWAGRLDNAPEARLSLATEAAGVYSLRLTWPEGRALTKRLIR